MFINSIDIPRSWSNYTNCLDKEDASFLWTINQVLMLRINFPRGISFLLSSIIKCKPLFRYELKYLWCCIMYIACCVFLHLPNSSKPILKPSKNWQKSRDRDWNQYFSISLTIFGEIFSKHFPPFPSMFFFSSRKKIFYFSESFPPVSSLLLFSSRKKDILLLQIFSSFFFSSEIERQCQRQRSSFCFPPSNR